MSQQSGKGGAPAKKQAMATREEFESLMANRADL